MNNTMNHHPLISVIMPVYNVEKYLRRAIDSVLNQTEKDFELIIIDDKSTDQTGSILQEYAKQDDRIILVSNMENRGLVYNLNLGLDMAKGDFIARMDGDDISICTRFEKQVDYLNNNPNIMLCSCYTMNFGKHISIYNLESDSASLRTRAFFMPVLAHPGFMMRRALISDKTLRYKEKYYTAEDYKFTIDTLAQHEIGIVPEVLLLYRIHDNQISFQRMEQQVIMRGELLKENADALNVKLSKEEIHLLSLLGVYEKREKAEYLQVMDIIIYISDKMKEKRAYKANIPQKIYLEWLLRSKGAFGVWITVMKIVGFGNVMRVCAEMVKRKVLLFYNFVRFGDEIR